jgi:hypothetical protein
MRVGSGEGNCVAVGTDGSAGVVAAAVGEAVGARAAGSAQEASTQQSNMPQATRADSFI